MAYLFLASIVATAAILRIRRVRRGRRSPARPSTVDRVVELLERSGFEAAVVGNGVVSHGSLFQIEAGQRGVQRVFGGAEPVRLRLQITASTLHGGQVAVEWRSGGASASHRDLMRQLGRSTVDWRAGVGGRGVVVDPGGLRIEPFMFDLAEVVLPILREEPDRLSVSVGDAGRRALGPAVGRGIRAF